MVYIYYSICCSVNILLLNHPCISKNLLDGSILHFDIIIDYFLILPNILYEHIGSFCDSQRYGEFLK